MLLPSPIAVKIAGLNPFYSPSPDVFFPFLLTRQNTKSKGSKKNPSFALTLTTIKAALESYNRVDFILGYILHLYSIYKLLEVVAVSMFAERPNFSKTVGRYPIAILGAPCTPYTMV